VVGKLGVGNVDDEMKYNIRRPWYGVSNYVLQTMKIKEQPYKSRKKYISQISSGSRRHVSLLHSVLEASTFMRSTLVDFFLRPIWLKFERVSFLVEVA